MMKRTFLAALAIGAVLASSVNAKTYSCNITPDNSRHWIPRTLLMNIDDQSGDILIYDDLIKTYPGTPVHGKLSAETDKRITVKWSLNQVHDDYGENTAHFFFRASYFKNTGKLIISSRPGSWDNMFGGQGRCRVTPDANWTKVLADTPVQEFSARGKARFFMSGERVLILP